MSKRVKEEQHPSLKGYIPFEPIPEGYKLDRLFSSSGIEGFVIEFLVRVEKIADVEKAA
jgi:hypothetical protein